MYKFRIFEWKKELPDTPPASHQVPKPRSGHRIVYFREALYSFGGYNPDVSKEDPDLIDDELFLPYHPLFMEVCNSFNLMIIRFT